MNVKTFAKQLPWLLVLKGKMLVGAQTSHLFDLHHNNAAKSKTPQNITVRKKNEKQKENWSLEKE